MTIVYIIQAIDLFGEVMERLSERTHTLQSKLVLIKIFGFLGLEPLTFSETPALRRRRNRPSHELPHVCLFTYFT